MIINQSVSGGGLKTITNVYDAYTGGALSLHELFMCLDSSPYCSGGAWLKFPTGVVCSVEDYHAEYSQYSVNTGASITDIVIDTTKQLERQRAEGITEYECNFDGSEWAVTGTSPDAQQDFGSYTTQDLATFGFTVVGNPEEGDSFSVYYDPVRFSIKSYSQGTPIYKKVYVDASAWTDDGESTCYYTGSISDIVCGDSPIIVMTMNNADMESFVGANGYFDYYKNVYDGPNCYGLEFRLACDIGNTPYLTIQFMILPRFGYSSEEDAIIFSTGKYGIQP